MTKAYLFLGLMTALCTAPLIAHAQDANCEAPQTNFEMKYCASQDLEAADKELNRVYKALRADQDDEANALLKTAQRAWIAYRDAECDRIADTARGGTMASLLYITCHAQFTEDRTKELATNPISGEVMFGQ